MCGVVTCMNVMEDGGTYNLGINLSPKREFCKSDRTVSGLQMSWHLSQVSTQFCVYVFFAANVSDTLKLITNYGVSGKLHYCYGMLILLLSISQYLWSRHLSIFTRFETFFYLIMSMYIVLNLLSLFSALAWTARCMVSRGSSLGKLWVLNRIMSSVPIASPVSLIIWYQGPVPKRINTVTSRKISKSRDCTLQFVKYIDT